MAVMLRAVVVVSLLSFLAPAQAPAQAPSVLHIKVGLLDAEQKLTPVPRHALLISDNPATSSPRRVVTAADGTVDVRLRPGNYTVESDQPVAFQGKAYQWTRTVDIVAGREAVLELTSRNAEIVSLTSVPAGSATSLETVETDPRMLLRQWQDSVVALWSPTAHASGFLIDANGLVVTNQRVVGTATSVEVQFSPSVKVAANVLVADQARDVAVLWIDPKAAASVRPVPLGCASAERPPVVEGQDIFAIGAPMRQDKDTASAAVRRVETRALLSDLELPNGGLGGPVFSAAGGVLGITTAGDERLGASRWNSRVVRIGDVCDVVASAEKKMKDASSPTGKLLPVEPVQPFPAAALQDAAKRRVGSLNPYQISSADFDIAFITPVQVRGASKLSPLMEFSNWSEYVEDTPPVLLVRVTPKMVESFWTKFGRAAASTQGVNLPAFKHIKSGFLRMRAYCGDAEVTPIHPFKLDLRVTETEAIYEGLYVFDPGAFAPSCASVKLVLTSEKEPEKAETKIVDTKVVQQIWQDFAPWRDQRP
jgi:S1-C subfamily serine protease